MEMIVNKQVIATSPLVDQELSETSLNPLTNKVITKALGNKQDKLTNPLTKSDVVNNLTTSTTNVPLSAAQGKALNDKLGNKQDKQDSSLTTSAKTVSGAINELVTTTSTINQNLSNKLSIPKSWTLLGSITPDTPQQIVLSDNVNNYDWIALLVHQGYASIDLIMPSYITRWNTTSRFSFNHGKPSGGWGMSGFVDFNDTNFMLSEHNIEGWEFVALELYGIK